MRLSTTPLDAALSPWAERLRQRLNLPLLVRWSGGSGLRLGDFEQPRVVVDVRDAAGAAALLSPSLDHLGRAYVEGHIDVSGTAHDIMDMAHRLAVAGSSADGQPGWVQRIAHRVADAVSHTRAEDRAAIDAASTAVDVFIDECPAAVKDAEVPRLDAILADAWLRLGARDKALLRAVRAYDNSADPEVKAHAAKTRQSALATP